MGRKQGTEKIDFNRDRLKWLLTCRYITRAELADEIDYSESAIKNCLTTKKIMPAMLNRIAKHLDVGYGYLLGTSNLKASFCQNSGINVPEDKIDDKGYFIPSYNEDLTYDRLYDPDESPLLFRKWLESTMFTNHYSSMLKLRYGIESSMSGDEALEIITKEYDSIEFFIEDLLLQYINGLIDDPLYDKPSL